MEKGWTGHRRWAGLTVLFVLFAGMLWTASPGQDDPAANLSVQGATAYTVSIAGVEKQSTAYGMLAKVNAARSNADARTLKWDTALEKAAIARAREASIYFSHTRPTGAQWYTVSSRMNAENLYVGYYASAATANSAWMKSPGHKANRLNGSYRAYGAAAFQGKDGAVYWVELFSKKTTSGTTAIKTNTSRPTASVRVTSGYLSLKSVITTLERESISDTSLRAGTQYYMTLKNWNKQFTYSYSLLSKGAFSSGNPSVASIDPDTGRITGIKGGVVTIKARPADSCGSVLQRTLVIRPNKISGMVLTAQTKEVSIQWNSASGASGYEIWRCTSKEGTYTQVASVDPQTLNFTHTGLSSGKTYYYKVRAYVTKSGSSTRYFGYCCAPEAIKVL